MIFNRNLYVYRLYIQLLVQVWKDYDFTCLSFSWTTFLIVKEEVSGTKIKGKVHKIIAKPMVETLENPWLIEKALSKGAAKDPSWENPYIDPAPIDWIYNGKDSVWIITIIKYPLAESIKYLLVITRTSKIKTVLIRGDFETNSNMNRVVKIGVIKYTIAKVFFL